MSKESTALSNDKRTCRILAQSLTCVEWCHRAEDGGRGLLLATNRLGQLLVWRVAEGASEEPSLCLLHDCGMGELRAVAAHRVDQARSMVTVASLDGRMAMLELHVSKNGVKAEDRGFLWSQKVGSFAFECLAQLCIYYPFQDMITPRAIKIVSDASSKARKDLRLLAIKDSFFLVLDVSTGKGRQETVITAHWKATPPFSSPLVDIIPCEGGHHFLVFPQRGSPKTVSVAKKEGGQLSLEVSQNLPELPAELDTADYRTHSVVASADGAAIFVVQSVCVYYDHLVFKSPGRLLVLTPFSRPQLGDRLLAKCMRGVLLNSCMEVFRVLLRKEVEMAAQSSPECPAIIEKTAKLIRDKLDDAEARQTCLWLSKLVAQLAVENESRELHAEFQQKVAQLTSELMSQSALDLLRRAKVKQPSRKQEQETADLKVPLAAAASFLARVRGEEVAYEWNCRLCGAPAQEWGLDWVRCSGGGSHTWPLCARTMRVCDEPPFGRCKWCGTMEKPSGDEGEGGCVLCGGPLTEA